MITLKNILTSGFTFTPDEYALENKYILANALLLVLSLTLIVASLVTFFLGKGTFIVLNLVSILLSFLILYLIRKIPKGKFHIFGYMMFLFFLIIIAYAYSLAPNRYPATSWFTVLIIPALFILGVRFAFVLAILYIGLLLVFNQAMSVPISIGDFMIELTPLILTIWFVYFSHQRYIDSLNVIEEKHQYLLRQSKMATMGEMMENIAHQWRQPLSQINSAVLLLDGILEHKGVEDKRIEEKLVEIESLTRYMSRTINDFKNFLEQKKELVSYSLDEILKKMILLNKSTLEKNEIALEYKVDKTLILDGYPYELQQVLLVLTNNAIDALSSRNIASAKISIVCTTDAKNVTIEICDNAGGISVDIIDKIFNPYFTTKKDIEGSGLGLYISKMVIEESMQGVLSVTNSSVGACFSVTIPQKLIHYK